MNNSPPPIQPGDESTSIPTPHTATPSHWRSKISGIWILEITLIAVTFGLTVLLWDSKGYQLLILYLFFLPVVLASFFLGRYQGGILAFLCVINAGLRRIESAMATLPMSCSAELIPISRTKDGEAFLLNRGSLRTPLASRLE